MRGITTFGGRRKSTDRILRTTLRSPTRILAPTGVSGPTTIPGRTQTYYEYPLALSAPPIRRYHAGRLARQPSLQDLRGGRNEAAVRRLADERVDLVHQGRCGLRRSSGAESKFRDQHSRTVLGEYGQDSGGYMLPWEIVASANFERRLGAPQSRQVQYTGGQTIRFDRRSTPIRSGRFGCRARTWWISGLPSGSGSTARSTLEGRFDFFNVFNANFVTARNLRSSAPPISFRRRSFCRGFFSWV